MAIIVITVGIGFGSGAVAERFVQPDVAAGTIELEAAEADAASELRDIAVPLERMEAALA